MGESTTGLHELLYRLWLWFGRVPREHSFLLFSLGKNL